MVMKGSCPKKNDCFFPHVMNNPRRIHRKVCFYEIIAPGNCRRGAQCHFTHDINETERTDEDFKTHVERERLAKKPVCINEYHQRNSCLKSETCTFRHNITEQERMCPETQKKMEEKWKKITGKSTNRKVPTEKTVSSSVVDEMRDFMREIREIVYKPRYP